MENIHQQRGVGCCLGRMKNAVAMLEYATTQWPYIDQNMFMEIICINFKSYMNQVHLSTCAVNNKDFLYSSKDAQLLMLL